MDETLEEKMRGNKSALNGAENPAYESNSISDLDAANGHQNPQIAGKPIGVRGGFLYLNCHEITGY